MRWNLRPVARAIDWPSEVLPTPGGPTKHRIGLLPSRVELAHREVLEDAALDLVQAEVVLVQDLPRFRDVDFLGTEPSFHGSSVEPLEVGPQHRALGAALAHALQALELLHRVLVHVLGHARVVDRLLQLLESPRRCRRPRPAPSGSGASARAARARAGARRTPSSSCRRSPSRCAARPRARPGAPAPCRGARLRSKVSSRSCLSSFLMSSRFATMSASSAGEVMPCTTTAELFGRVRQQADRLDRLRLELQEARLDLRRLNPRSRGSVATRATRIRPAVEEFEHAEAALRPAPRGGACLRRR